MGFPPDVCAAVVQRAYCFFERPSIQIITCTTPVECNTNFTACKDICQTFLLVAGQFLRRLSGWVGMLGCIVQRFRWESDRTKLTPETPAIAYHLVSAATEGALAG